jgi:hypothetical protein
MMAKWIFVGKEKSGQALVDDYHPWVVGIVIAGESSPLHQRNAHGAKVVGADEGALPLEDRPGKIMLPIRQSYALSDIERHQVIFFLQTSQAYACNRYRIE